VFGPQDLVAPGLAPPHVLIELLLQRQNLGTQRRGVNPNTHQAASHHMLETTHKQPLSHQAAPGSLLSGPWAAVCPGWGCRTTDLALQALDPLAVGLLPGLQGPLRLQSGGPQPARLRLHLLGVARRLLQEALGLGVAQLRVPRLGGGGVATTPGYSSGWKEGFYSVDGSPSAWLRMNLNLN
jgi:hypothetical protein